MNDIIDENEIIKDIKTKIEKSLIELNEDFNNEKLPKGAKLGHLMHKIGFINGLLYTLNFTNIGGLSKIFYEEECSKKMLTALNFCNDNHIYP